MYRRSTSLPSWLQFKKPGVELLQERLDDIVHRTQKVGSFEAPPIIYTVPGSFGVAIPGTEKQVAGVISHRKQPACFTTQKAAITFQGYLSNLGELVDELCYRSFSELGTSYESEFGRGSFQPLSGGDQAMLAAEVLLHMYLQASDPNELTILLSELQGQFSFVIFDSSKRRVFAARDASGIEPLFVDDEDGSVFSFTNNPHSVLGEGSNTWQEVLPGHYYSCSKNPKMQQFALTPEELLLRERAETSDLSISPSDVCPSPKAGTGQALVASSARSSLEHEWLADRLFRISV